MGRIALGVAFLGTLVGGIVYLVAQMSGSDAVADESPAAGFVEVPDYVDPACLWPVLSVGLQPDAVPAPDQVAVQGCAPKGTLTHDEDGWARVAIEGSVPDGGEGASPRRTGARIVQVGKHLSLVLETYDNWGGSGVFSTLVTARLDADGERLISLSAHGFGDRCTGGLAGTEVRPDGSLLASANMTPWDILVSPLDEETLWNVGSARYGAAFLETPSCAICCSAVTRDYVVDAVAGTMKEVGLRYAVRAASSMPDNPIAACLELAVRQAAGADGLVTGAQEADLEQAIAACVAIANRQGGG